MDSNKILVWLQTSVRRNPQRTIDSIELSDIGARFVVVTDRKKRVFPQDYDALQQWWERSWREMAEAARLRGCNWLLRLEDDIEVNRYILRNVCSWRAPRSSRFGLGNLFIPERDYPTAIDQESGEHYYLDPEVAGAQAQLVHVELVAPLLDRVSAAAPCFDKCLSRAAQSLGKRVFCHRPSLIRLHELESSLELPATRTVSRTKDSFKPNWIREAPPASRRANVAPMRRAPTPIPSPPIHSQPSRPPSSL